MPGKQKNFIKTSNHDIIISGMSTYPIKVEEAVERVHDFLLKNICAMSDPKHDTGFCLNKIPHTNALMELLRKNFR